MNVLKYPILIIAVCFGLGIVIQNYVCLSFEVLISTWIILSVLFAILFLKYKSKNYKGIFFGLISYLLTIATGSLSLFFNLDYNQKNHYTNIGIKEQNLLKALVIEELKPNAFYTKFVLEIDSFNHQKSRGKLLVYFSKKNSDTLVIGDVLRLKVAILPVPKNFNPNSFDYANYLENRNIFHQIKCYAYDYVVVNQEKNTNFYINKLRTVLVKSFEAHLFPEKVNAIINALLLGQKQQLDASTLNDYKNAGVIHILAISGLHIGIIYAFFNFIFGFLNRLKHGKTIKLFIIIILLWVFALISGMSASITRAVTMFSLFALGAFLNRRNNAFNSIAASFLVVLIFSPLLIFDIGFQLSYAAVISILLFQPFFNFFYFSKQKWAVYIADLFLVSLAAQIGVLPLMLLYFKQIPLLFLAANFVVIPVSTAVLILGVMLLFLNFIYMPLALVLGKLISILVAFMNFYIHWLSSFDTFIVKNIAFTPLLTIVFYLLIFSTIYWAYRPKNKQVLVILFMIICFQISYFITIKTIHNKSELIVFNFKESTLSIFDSQHLRVYSNDSLIAANQNMQDYITAHFNPRVSFHPLENVVYFNNKKIMIVDQEVVYKTSILPDVVILRQNSRVNIERLLITTKPKIIIADKSNSFTSISRWKKVCLQYKIPFHAVAEKGFYKM